MAADSEVAVATLYKYFPAKGALACAWLRSEIRSALAEAIEGGHGAERSVRPALRQVVVSLAEAAAQEPDLRLEAWTEAGRAAAQPASEWAELVGGLSREQESERVRRDLSAGALAESLVDAIEGGLVAGLHACAGVEGRSERREILTGAMRGRLDLVLDGARKRNERVRAPSTGSDRRAHRGAEAAPPVPSGSTLVGQVPPDPSRSTTLR